MIISFQVCFKLSGRIIVVRRWIQHCWDNGLVTNRWQSIISANDGLVYWHIQAPLGTSELMWWLCVIAWFMLKYSHSWINMVVGDGLGFLVPRRLQPSWIHDDVSCLMHIKATHKCSSLYENSSAQKSHTIIRDLRLFASENTLLMAAMW